MPVSNPCLDWLRGELELVFPMAKVDAVVTKVSHSSSYIKSERSSSHSEEEWKIHFGALRISFPPFLVPGPAYC